MSLAYPVMDGRAEISSARWRKPFETFLDGVEAGWAIPLLLIGFVAVWLAFLCIAYAGGDLHQDVLETWSLGRSIEWGYSKHPPLMGWAARAWMTFFPLTNWSFELMAMVNSAIALWMVDLITRRFATGDKRALVLLLLMLLPIYQFHAQRFNANAVLLPTWPLAAYCFLRSFETRATGWAVAAGATAALAMLGKYYSVFLVGSFAVAAICHPQRRAYFGSFVPWISAVTGFAALVPHMYWLATTGAKPFAYAVDRHAGKALVPSLWEAVLFVSGIVLVLAVPAAICAAIAGDRLKTLRWNVGAINLRRFDPGLLLLLYISLGTVVFPAVTAVLFGTDMPLLWALQGLFLFVIVIVCSMNFPIPRFHSVNVAAAAFVMALLAVFLAAPAHALYRNYHPLHEGRNFYQLAATELTRQWHVQSDEALPAAGGDEGLAFALAFYSTDHPVFDERLVHPHTLELPAEVTFERGWAALCYVEDSDCVSSTENVAARSSKFVRSEFVVQATLLGQPGATQRFAAFIVPPSSADRSIRPAAPKQPGIAEDFSASRRAHPRWD
jgi:4-amino-4-deoxy-L-arabinose transferase-like glycosyltransferase